MKKYVYIVEEPSEWGDGYEIDEVFEDKDKALDYAANYAVERWSPIDEDEWIDEMERTNKYISKFDYKRTVVENQCGGIVRVSEYELQ